MCTGWLSSASANHYSYFAWPTQTPEITQYFRELTQTEVREYFAQPVARHAGYFDRGVLQFGGRPAFMIRLVLAWRHWEPATGFTDRRSSFSKRPRRARQRRYFNSEKYGVKHWDRGSADSLKELSRGSTGFAGRIPRCRAIEAYGSTRSITSRSSAAKADGGSRQRGRAVVVNLDPHHVQSGLGQNPAWRCGSMPRIRRTIFAGARVSVGMAKKVRRSIRIWRRPTSCRLRRRVRREQDFDDISCDDYEAREKSHSRLRPRTTIPLV